VLKHEQLQFGKLPEKVQLLRRLGRHFFFVSFNFIRFVLSVKALPLSQRVVRTFNNNLVDKPNGRPISWIFVAVYFLLLECPILKLLVVCPEGNSGWDMDEPELARLRFPCFVILAIDNLELEESVIMSTMVVPRPSRKFLIGGHGR